jgi:deoxyribodipyrimidine photo-lyase
MLSARQAVLAAREAIQLAPDRVTGNSADIWLNELIWREFYISILYHFPEVSRQSFRSSLRRIAWRNDPDEFDAWTKGMTGYPVVDAGMRELNATGWMHNRARMITASFLVKDLLVDWRWGEAYFMSQLIDGDPAANNGGWQWTAGTGTDAAPYFRIFNPVLQGQKFDPDGMYVRKWVPELSDVPIEYLHQPWRMPGSIQEASGCRIGIEYPRPIVDHSERRLLTLAAYERDC